MEQKTLQELNDEYKDLVKKVEEIKIELKKAIATKETADGKVESASDEFNSKKTIYDALKKGFEQAENAGFTSELMLQMKEQVEKAENEMNDAKAALDKAEEDRQNASEELDTVKSASEKESRRLDVILVSFGANETINKAISNEIEIDYTEMADKKENERKQLDELKTKINDDSKIQEEVGNLGELLKKFEEQKKKVNETKPENAAKETANLLKVADQIKLKRNAIKRRMRKLGLEGGKISNEEVDKMTTARDAQGRIVVDELERRTTVVDNELANIQIEKDAMLDKMAMALEKGRQDGEEQEKYNAVKSEILALNAEKSRLEHEQEESNKILADIATQKEEANKELAALGTSDVDQDKIKALQDERDAIAAEKVEEIDNPEKLAIKQQIKELNDKKKVGTPTNVETPEYQAADKAYKLAQAALNNEMKTPTITAAVKTDEIIANPNVIAIESEIKVKEKSLNDFENAIIDGNPELKHLKEYIAKLKEEEKQLNDELKTAREEVSELGKTLIEKHVSEDIHPELANEGSTQATAFAAYRQAELELRKAMIALEKDPSDDNVNALEAARTNFSEKTAELQDALTVSGAKPSPDAIHKYLFEKLKEDYDNLIPLDEGYDLNNTARRIENVKSAIKKDERALVDALSTSTEDLEKILVNMLAGKDIDEGALANAIKTHRRNLDNFEDPDKVKSLLKGVDIGESNGRFGFIRRIVASFRRNSTMNPKYPPFKEQKAPAEQAAYKDAIEKKGEIQVKLNRKAMEIKDAQTDFDNKRNDAMTPEQKNDFSKKQEEVAKLREKLNGLPAKINKTRLTKLKDGVTAAKAKLDATPQYKMSINVAEIEAQIADLTQKADAMPDKVENSEKAADKKRRLAEKDTEIEKAKKGTENPRRNALVELLAKLEGKEVEETRKSNETKSRLDGVNATLIEKKGLLAILEVAGNKIKNLIHIKDANRMLDRRSGRIAQELVEATRGNKSKEADDREDR